MAKPKTVRGPYVIDELIVKRGGHRYWMVYQRFTFLEGVWAELTKLTGLSLDIKPAEFTKIRKSYRVFRWRANALPIKPAKVINKQRK